MIGVLGNYHPSVSLVRSFHEINQIRSDDVLTRLYNANAPAEVVADRMEEMGLVEWPALTRRHGRTPILNANSCYGHHVQMIPGMEIERRRKQERYFSRLYPFLSYVNGAKKNLEEVLASGVDELFGPLTQDQFINCRDRLSEIDGYIREVRARERTKGVEACPT